MQRKINYIICIIFCILFICCTPYTAQKEDTNLYKEIYCPYCNGIGKRNMTTSEKVSFCIATFGFGAVALDLPTECDICNGTGVIKIRDLENERKRKDSIGY